MRATSIVSFAARSIAAACVLLAAVSCIHMPGEPGSLATITVTRNPDTLSVLGVRQFSAIGRDANGTAVGINPAWTLAAGGGAVNASGVFTAGSTVGTFANTIVATVGSISGSATVTVLSGLPATIVISPTPVTLAPGAAQQFTVVVKDAGGNVVASTPMFTAALGSGSVNQSGLYTAGAVAGTYATAVTATVGTLTASASVTITAAPLASVTVTPNPMTLAAGGTQQYAATGKDGNGNIVAFTPTWSVQAGGGVIGGTGIFTAGATPGTFVNTIRACSTVTCAAGSIMGFATVTVNATGAPGVLATINVTPNPANVVVNAPQQFLAQGLDGTGSIVATPSLVWSVVNGGGVINAATGTFQAGAIAGTFLNTIKATSGTVSGFATVNVTASVVVTGVTLGTAAANGILAGTAVTCAGAPGSIGGDVSVSPGTSISGFPPCTISGNRHPGDATAAQQQVDLTTAYNALAAMPCGTTITGDLGGTTLAPGVYCAGGGVGVTGPVTLNGPAGSVFVIRAGTSLTTAGSVVMSGGADASSVYWWTGSSATLGSGSAWQGNILSLTSVTLVDGVTLSGRALARNGAVTLGVGSHITLP